MKKILISQAIYTDKQRNECGDSLDGSIITFLYKAGYLAIPVSNFYTNIQHNRHESLLTYYLSQLNVDGLLLTGGADLGLNKIRDSTERTLINWATAMKIPVLGLCRGMQILGKMLGSELQKIDGHINTKHLIKGKISTRVNSFHQYGFKALPTKCDVTAQADDGCIEAFQYMENNWHGWMWHPEREKTFRKFDLKLLKDVFQ